MAAVTDRRKSIYTKYPSQRGGNAQALKPPIKLQVCKGSGFLTPWRALISMCMRMTDLSQV